MTCGGFYLKPKPIDIALPFHSSLYVMNPKEHNRIFQISSSSAAMTFEFESNNPVALQPIVSIFNTGSS